MTVNVAILAPAGRNEQVIAQVLKKAGYVCDMIEPQTLLEGINADRFSAAVLTEEALYLLPMDEVRSVLARQEAWSDFKFVLLIPRGELSAGTVARIRALGNVSLVERPMRPATLVNTVRSSLRARQRQRDAKFFIGAHAEAERKLRLLAESLEARVLERTQELTQANHALQLEMAARIDAHARMDVMQAELIHISRVSAMGTMASTIAHELNQPLAAVMNYVVASRHLLEQSNIDVPAKILAALDGARANAHEAAEIVRRLRDLVARGEVNRRRTHLPTLIDDALKLGLIDAISVGVSCQVALDPEAPAVLVDRVQIQQVLVNLIRNSVEAMQNSVTKQIRITSHRLAKNMVEVIVTDTGPGIDAAIMSAMFSPFNTSKSDGLGIGLSISRTIIEANGGTITGENGLDGGAVLRFTLPCPASEAVTPDAEPATAVG